MIRSFILRAAYYLVVLGVLQVLVHPNNQQRIIFGLTLFLANWVREIATSRRLI